MSFQQKQKNHARFTRLGNFFSAQPNMVQIQQKILSKKKKKEIIPNRSKGGQERHTSNIDIALLKNTPSVSPALVNASTHHNVHKQNVPSSPPTPSSAF